MTSDQSEAGSTDAPAQEQRTPVPPAPGHDEPITAEFSAIRGDTPSVLDLSALDPSPLNPSAPNPAGPDPLAPDPLSPELEAALAAITAGTPIAPYQAEPRAEGEPVVLPASTPQAETESAAAFWRHFLETTPSVRLHVDMPREGEPSLRKFSAKLRSVGLDEAWTALAGDDPDRRGAAAAATAAAAVARLSGPGVIVVGVQQPEGRTVAIALGVYPTTTMAALVDEAAAELVRTRRLDDVPAGLRDESGNPLLQVVVLPWTGTPQGVTLEADLVLGVVPEALQVAASSDVFRQESLRAIATVSVVITKASAKSPHVPLGELDLGRGPSDRPAAPTPVAVPVDLPEPDLSLLPEPIDPEPAAPEPIETPVAQEELAPLFEPFIEPEPVPAAPEDIFAPVPSEVPAAEDLPASDELPVEVPAEPVPEPVMAEPVIEDEVPAAQEKSTPEPTEPEPAPVAPEPPVMAEPVVIAPVLAEPTVIAPVLAEPAVEAPAVEGPPVESLVVVEPVLPEPVVAEPVVAEPVTPEPVLAAPTPAAHAPAAVEPDDADVPYTPPWHVIAIHAGNSPSPWTNLAGHLAENVAIDVVTAAVPRGNRPATIADLAAACHTQLTRIQPRGRFVIAGYGAGAVVAYELATQMLVSGLTVELVVSVNGPTPAFLKPPEVDTKAIVPIRQPTAAGTAAVAARQASRWLRKRAVQTRTQLEPWRAWAQDALAQRASRPAGGEDEDPTVLAARNVYLRESRFPIPALPLLVIRTPALYPPGSADLGWSELTTGTVRVADVEGTPWNSARAALEEPAVGNVATALTEAFAEL